MAEPTVVPEGPLLQSKKFVAFLVSSILWKILAVIIIVWGRDITFVWSLLLAIILVAGFVEAGYIIGQASLDKYVRLAHIAAQNGSSIPEPSKSLKHHKVSKGSVPPEESAG